MLNQMLVIRNQCGKSDSVTVLTASSFHVNVIVLQYDVHLRISL